MKTAPKQKRGESRQDYGTPFEFLKAVMRLLRIEAFDLDCAASKENKVAVRFHSTEDNGLLESWSYGEGWNWLNHPFANIRPWVEKAEREWKTNGVRTAVLVPAGVGSNWWREHVHRKACVLLLNGRLTFEGCDQPYPKDCCLLLYGKPPGYCCWRWQDQDVDEFLWRMVGGAVC